MAQEYNIERQWHWTIGDRLEPFAVDLQDADGQPRVLTGCTVAFKLVRETGSVVVIASLAATIESALLGKARYDPTAADVTAIGSTPQDYWAYVIVTEGGLNATYPPDGRKWRFTTHSGG